MTKHGWISGLALVLSTAATAPHHITPTPLTPNEQHIKQILHNLVTREDNAIITGHKADLRSIILPHSDALARAEKRARYLKVWATSRGLDVRGITISLRTPHIRFVGRGRVNIFGVVGESYRVTKKNAAPVKDTPDDRFGLGVRHDYVLVKERGQWFIASDDFTDPLNQDTRLLHQALPAQGSVQAHPLAISSRGAEKAVQYANTYCGSAPGCGNDRYYNSDYTSYNGEGGDCTNFVSQALHAGGFLMSPHWEYSQARGEGSPAWVNADRLKDFLESSGHATLYASGPYNKLTRPLPRFPDGAVNALRPGDLISYVEGHRAVHTAIVVGYDTLGFPVVDTHTSDRYRVPWDLGWDRRTIYDLWHVHYPRSVVFRTSSPRSPGTGDIMNHR